MFIPALVIRRDTYYIARLVAPFFDFTLRDVALICHGQRLTGFALTWRTL